MKARRTFNINATLASARAGALTGAELTRAITIAKEMGQDEVAEELQLLKPVRIKQAAIKKVYPER